MRDKIVSDVKAGAKFEEGVKRIVWASKSMPVLGEIKDRFHRERPFKGITIGCCLHVTAETANLMRTLVTGGADVILCASNPLSTQDVVAKALVLQYGIGVFAVHGESSEKYHQHLQTVLSRHPQIIIDDGADLIVEYHRSKEAPFFVRGALEETTTGVTRLRALEREGKLKFPVIAVNDSETKHMFDNRYGTGQSTIDGIIRATNHLIAGKTVVVLGYGWCGRGVAARAQGMGANVVVTEIDHVKALEAVMDGFRVMTMEEASKAGDLFITVTGNHHVIRSEHFRVMKSGAVVCNSGHFNVEIDLEALRRMARKGVSERDNVEAYYVEGNRVIYVLGQGRLINLAAAEGHPAMVMDMSFANQALGAEYIVRHSQMSKSVHVMDKKIDQRIAQLKLQSMGVSIDVLTEEQRKYLSSWELGT